MSYDLIFWREIRPLDAPQHIYEQVLEDVDIDGLAALDLDQVKQVFQQQFPGIDDEGASMMWEGDESYFQLSWPPNPVNALIVTCGYKLLDSPDTMNRIIDSAHVFGCALYDPQVNERFDQPDPRIPD